MHCISNVLRLTTDEFLLLALDIILFLAIVGNCKLVDIFDKLLLHAGLQGFKTI